MPLVDTVKQLRGMHDRQVDQGPGGADDAAERGSPGHDGPTDTVVRKAQDATRPTDGGAPRP